MTHLELADALSRLIVLYEAQGLTPGLTLRLSELSGPLDVAINAAAVGSESRAYLEAAAGALGRLQSNQISRAAGEPLTPLSSLKHCADWLRRQAMAATPTEEGWRADLSGACSKLLAAIARETPYGDPEAALVTDAECKAAYGAWNRFAFAKDGDGEFATMARDIAVEAGRWLRMRQGCDPDDGLSLSQHEARLKAAVEELRAKLKPGNTSAAVADAEPADGTATDALSGEAKALALLVQHPEWSDARIAQECGCHRTSLYRMPKFKAARSAAREGRSSLPRGRKDADTGDIEAWD